MCGELIFNNENICNKCIVQSEKPEINPYPYLKDEPEFSLFGKLFNIFHG
jgi:hypothetical protein